MQATMTKEDGWLDEQIDIESPKGGETGENGDGDEGAEYGAEVRG